MSDPLAEERQGIITPAWKGNITEDDYVLRAFAGQIMEVAITSPRTDVRLAIVGEDGIP